MTWYEPYKLAKLELKIDLRSISEKRLRQVLQTTKVTDSQVKFLSIRSQAVVTPPDFWFKNGRYIIPDPLTSCSLDWEMKVFEAVRPDNHAVVVGSTLTGGKLTPYYKSKFRSSYVRAMFMARGDVLHVVAFIDGRVGLVSSRAVVEGDSAYIQFLNLGFEAYPKRYATAIKAAKHLLSYPNLETLAFARNELP